MGNHDPNRTLFKQSSIAGTFLDSGVELGQLALTLNLLVIDSPHGTSVLPRSVTI